jgi:hypothetical protein
MTMALSVLVTIEMLNAMNRWHDYCCCFCFCKLKKLRGFGSLANYADRATAASWRSSTNFCG